MDEATYIRELKAAARAVHLATECVIVRQTADGHLSAAESGWPQGLDDDVLCVLRPGIPESHANAAIHFQARERRRMGGCHAAEEGKV